MSWNLANDTTSPNYRTEPFILNGSVSFDHAPNEEPKVDKVPDDPPLHGASVGVSEFPSPQTKSAQSLNVENSPNDAHDGEVSA